MVDFQSVRMRRNSPQQTLDRQPKRLGPNPIADIFLRSDNWAAINSRNGIYDKSLQEVKLFGDVHIYYDRGFELKTDSIKLDLKRGTATGSDNVNAFGPGGEIHAEGLRIVRKGKHVKFLGKSKAKFLVPGNDGS